VAKNKKKRRRPGTGGRVTRPAPVGLRNPPDARLEGVAIKADEPQGVPPNSWVSHASFLRIAGEVYVHSGLDPVARFLIGAKEHRDTGEKLRSRILASRHARVDGNFEFKDEQALLDAVTHLTSAVLLTFLAVEATGNACIAKLPADATLEVERRGLKVVLARDSMERQLSVAEKLDRIPPLLYGSTSMKGTAAWGRFVHLRRLRDGLVHLKDPGYSRDPDDPGPFSQLLAGDAAQCVEDAVAVIMSADPRIINDRARPILGITERTHD
jgi:hypothetical protein